MKKMEISFFVCCYFYIILSIGGEFSPSVFPSDVNMSQLAGIRGINSSIRLLVCIYGTLLNVRRCNALLLSDFYHIMTLWTGTHSYTWAHAWQWTGCDPALTHTHTPLTLTFLFIWIRIHRGENWLSVLVYLQRYSVISLLSVGCIQTLSGSALNNLPGKKKKKKVEPSSTSAAYPHSF